MVARKTSTPRLVLIGLGLFLLPAAAAAAAGPESAPSRELIDGTVDLVQGALRSGSYEKVKHACKRALVLRPDCDAEQFQPVARAVSAGLRHKDPRIALVCVRSLGEFRCPGTSRCIAPLLRPPGKVKDAWLPVHLAAIEVAGRMHEPRSVAALENLISHDSQILARAACAALAGYEEAEPKERLDVVRRLANQLGRLERKRVKGEFAATQLRKLREALRDCLRELTGVKDLESSSQARDWLRRQPDPDEAEPPRS